MTLSLEKIVTFFYLAIGLDSLLKLNLGIKIHLGLVLIILINILLLFRFSDRALKCFKSDKNFYLFVIYCFLNGLLMGADGFSSIFFYLLVAANVAFFVFYTHEMWTKTLFIRFQWILIITGLTQFLVYKLGGYQISFIDAEHYMKGYSVTGRLRGFFLEPNWFAIAITFNSIILFGSKFQKFYDEHRWAFILTFIVMILNGTFATLGILILIYMFPVFRESPPKAIIYTALFTILLTSILMFRGGLSHNSEVSFNHNSRLIPLERVVEYQGEQDVGTLLFGNGLGSWGQDAIYNRLSVLVFEENPSARDGSEIPVFLFELGIIGLLLIILDAIYLIIRAGTNQFQLGGAVVLFIVCMTFYPIFKFLMYMPYYFYIRGLILKKDEHI